MYEWNLTQRIVEYCSEQAAGARVDRVILEVGCLRGVRSATLQFCYEHSIQQTPLQGSELAIVELPSLAQCRDCGRRFSPLQLASPCPCGSHDLDFLQGDELQIRALEMI